MRSFAKLGLLFLGLASCDPSHPSTQTVAGEKLLLEFTLRAEDDVAVGFNHFDLSVRAKDGTVPAEDLVVTAHSAASPTEEIAVRVQRLGEGRYILLDVMFPTAGDWALAIEGTTGDGSQDSATFPVDVR